MMKQTPTPPKYDMFYDVERLPDDFDEEHSAEELRRWRKSWERHLADTCPGMYVFPGRAFWVRGTRQGVTVIWKEYDAVMNKH
jgi:hypothetical protein